MTQQHLLTLWNPVYGARVVEKHVDMLLRYAKEYRAGKRDLEDVCVWWGKVRSPNRLQPLPHLDQVLSLPTEESRDHPDPETHLYLTDFESLYVAHLGEIRGDDVLRDPEQREWIPDYYFDTQLSCDCWFLVWDVRRLVLNDTVGVVHELRKLLNVRHDNRPVSIYGGMIDLPLIVTETEPQRYFDAPTRDRMTGGRLWVEFDAERRGIGAMERELRENLFGDTSWRGLHPTTRDFVATAEKIYRDHLGDVAFDFAPVVVELSKAVEVQSNYIVRRALRNSPVPCRTANIDGQSQDLCNGNGPFTLAQLGRAITSNSHLANELSARLQDGAWFTSQFAPVMIRLAEVRNPAAHSSRLDREAAAYWRDQLVGIGCYGHLPRLGQVQVRN